VLGLLVEDLTTVLSLDSSEPSYCGNPLYVANYPCLVSVPSSSGCSVGPTRSPLWGDFDISHRIVYLFQGDKQYAGGSLDSYHRSQLFGDSVMNWLAAATLYNRMPLVDPDGVDDDTNWLIDMYVTPWRLTIQNEFQNALKQARPSENLFAPLVEFTTRSRRFIGGTQ